MNNEIDVSPPRPVCGACGGSGMVPGKNPARPSWEPPVYGPIPAPQICTDCLEDRVQEQLDNMGPEQRAELEESIREFAKDTPSTRRLTMSRKEIDVSPQRPMTDAELTTLEQEIGNATPLPWSRYASGWDNPPYEYIYDKLPGYGGQQILHIKRMPDGSFLDHDFIIAACNALPRLLADVRRLTALVYEESDDE